MQFLWLRNLKTKCSEKQHSLFQAQRMTQFSFHPKLFHAYRASDPHDNSPVEERNSGAIWQAKCSNFQFV